MAPLLLNKAISVSPSGGCSIVLYNSTGDSNEYCCNSIVVEPGNGLPVCSSGNPFLIPDGDIISGKGVLAQFVTTSSAISSTTGSSTSKASSTACDIISTTSSPSHDMVIGLGTGLPLGVLLVAAASWAVWENRQRRKLRKDATSATMMHNMNYGAAPKAEIYSEDRRHELF